MWQSTVVVYSLLEVLLHLGRQIRLLTPTVHHNPYVLSLSVVIWVVDFRYCRLQEYHPTVVFTLLGMNSGALGLRVLVVTTGVVSLDVSSVGGCRGVQILV